MKSPFRSSSKTRLRNKNELTRLCVEVRLGINYPSSLWILTFMSSDWSISNCDGIDPPEATTSGNKRHPPTKEGWWVWLYERRKLGYILITIHLYIGTTNLKSSERMPPRLEWMVDVFLYHSPKDVTSLSDLITSNAY